MAAHHLHHRLILLFILFNILSLSESKLSYNYYAKTCPTLEQIMEETTTNKQIKSPSTAAGTVRLFFHDCFVTGCDASTLISSTPFNTAERDAEINLSLPGDGFDVVVRAKAALELACPGVVSCSDILAVAARNLVSFVGGPFYPVLLGRKDSLVSKASLVEGHLPRPSMSMDQMIAIFTAHNFTAQEMVALSGAHTIGFSHCKEFASGIYNYSSTQQFDPTYNPRFAAGLEKACANYQKDPPLSVFNDIMTPGKFDNMYFQNLPKGLGILASDRVLFTDPRTRPFVQVYAKYQSVFFRDFAKAMQKLSLVGVKTGRHGQVRRRCDAFNN